MSYVLVKDINKVSIGQNWVYNGAIALSTDEENDIVYACIDDRYFKFSYDGMEEDTSFRGRVYGYQKMPRIVLGRFIAFKLNINGRAATYSAIYYRNENIPILIHQSISLGEDDLGNELKNINFCYNPKKDPEGNCYIGAIGYASEDLYNTVVNKSRLLNKPMPKTNYVAKAEKLKQKVNENKYIPLAYDSSHEKIELDDIFPQEMNKLYLLNKLNFIINNYSNGKIYYSGCLKELERKTKVLSEYFKNVI